MSHMHGFVLERIVAVNLSMWTQKNYRYDRRKGVYYPGQLYQM